MIKLATIQGFLDELDKIAQTVGEYQQRMEGAIRGAGGRMTPEAYAAGRAGWERRKQVLGELKPRAAAHRALLSRTAKLPAKPGLFSRLVRALG